MKDYKLIWFLNLFVLGLGNYYASGRLWWLIVGLLLQLTQMSQGFKYGFGGWLQWYLVFSVVGFFMASAKETPRAGDKEGERFRSWVERTERKYVRGGTDNQIPLAGGNFSRDKIERENRLYGRSAEPGVESDEGTDHFHKRLISEKPEPVARPAAASSPRRSARQENAGRTIPAGGSGVPAAVAVNAPSTPPAVPERIIELGARLETPSELGILPAGYVLGQTALTGNLGLSEIASDRKEIASNHSVIASDHSEIANDHNLITSDRNVIASDLNVITSDLNVISPAGFDALVQVDGYISSLMHASKPAPVAASMGVAPSVVPPASASENCPLCGADTSHGFSFCTTCGHAFGL